MIEAKDYPNRKLGKRLLAPADAVGKRLVTVNLEESPLSWLASRGMVTPQQVLAGERLRDDHARSGLTARVTMRWEERVGGGAGGATGASKQALNGLEAKRRFDKALEAVGPGLSDVLWRVVCEGEGLTAAEKALGWPARAGKLVLGMALDRLVDHYSNQIG